MEKYRFLEHTADAKFQAYGETLEEAFTNAASAMFSIMTDTSKVAKKTKKAIAVDGDDLKSLLVKFLSEFLFLLDAENFLLNSVGDVKITKTSGNYKLKAVAYGDDAANYETKGDIKAVTYSDIKVEEKPPMVQVVVDI
ncbi:MAG: archease [Candidatus Woesearchaeota archaeon]